MNWNAKDVQLFLTEREYIDTAVIPLLPVAFGDQMKRAAEQGEFVNLISMHLERQFKGRMLVFPPFTYLDEPNEDLLNQWGEKAKENGFSYIFFITSDNKWKMVNNINNGTLVHVASIPLEHMDDQYKHKVMDEQTKNMMSKIIVEWQKG